MLYLIVYLAIGLFVADWIYKEVESNPIELVAVVIAWPLVLLAYLGG